LRRFTYLGNLFQGAYAGAGEVFRSNEKQTIAFELLLKGSNLQHTYQFNINPHLAYGSSGS
jgi:hypothetical protein